MRVLRELAEQWMWLVVMIVVTTLLALLFVAMGIINYLILEVI